jgi:hypothetical protein
MTGLDVPRWGREDLTALCRKHDHRDGQERRAPGEVPDEVRGSCGLNDRDHQPVVISAAPVYPRRAGQRGSTDRLGDHYEIGEVAVSALRPADGRRLARPRPYGPQRSLLSY